MKKFTISLLATLAMSASALAATPASYDTKFNVSANIPDDAKITDPGGMPITNMDIEMVPAASGKMEGSSPMLKLWNNGIDKLNVSLILDDSQASTGEAFTLYSTQGGTLSDMSYQVSTITSDSDNGAKAKKFTNSGDTLDYTLKASADQKHGELPLVFKFVSTKNYSELSQGHYTGVVYANLVVKS